MGLIYSINNSFGLVSENNYKGWGDYFSLRKYEAKTTSAYVTHIF